MNAENRPNSATTREELECCKLRNESRKLESESKKLERDLRLQWYQQPQNWFSIFTLTLGITAAVGWVFDARFQRREAELARETADLDTKRAAFEKNKLIAESEELTAELAERRNELDNVTELLDQKAKALSRISKAISEEPPPDAPTVSDVRNAMKSILVGGGHTTPETALRQLAFLLRVIETLGTPPLSSFSEGVVAAHFERILDENGPFRVTSRGRVWYEASLAG